jgi:hypothetical protein
MKMLIPRCARMLNEGYPKTGTEPVTITREGVGGADTGGIRLA